MRDSKLYTLLSAGKVRAIVSSTNASPINIEVTGHGFSTGDRLTINGHATNTAANGTWIITKVDANNFTLDGSTGNGIGGATGCAADASDVIQVEDWRHLIVSIATDGGGDAAMTLKFVGAYSDTDPDFAKTQTASNMYDFIEVIDMQDGSAIDGDTGFVVATADDYRMFEINVNGLKWLSVLATAGTAGEATIKLRTFNN